MTGHKGCEAGIYYGVRETQNGDINARPESLRPGPAGLSIIRSVLDDRRRGLELSHPAFEAQSDPLRTAWLPGRGARVCRIDSLRNAAGRPRMLPV